MVVSWLSDDYYNNNHKKKKRTSMNAPIPSTNHPAMNSSSSSVRVSPRMFDGGASSCHKMEDDNSSSNFASAAASRTTTSHAAKPLHHSSPMLRNAPTFPPSVVNPSRSNPTMSTFKGSAGMRRAAHYHLHHQANASFAATTTTTRQQPQLPPQQQGLHVNAGRRNSLVGLDKIVQRSSSKSVKQMLSHLEALANAATDDASATAAPGHEVNTLLELSADSYYRVVIHKCHGVEIVQQLMQRFPDLTEACQQLLQILGTTTFVAAESPRSTRTTMPLESGGEKERNTPVMEGLASQALRLAKKTSVMSTSNSSCCSSSDDIMEEEGEDTTPMVIDYHHHHHQSSEDIVTIINEGCREYLLFRQDSSSANNNDAAN